MDTTATLSGQIVRSTIQEYFADLRRMLGHCRDQGIAIPDSVGHNVVVILGKDIDSVDAANFELLLHVHGQLSGIIAPATPRSLAATEFSLRAWLTYFLVALFIIAAVGGLIGYVRTLPSPAVVEGQLTAGDVAAATWPLSQAERQTAKYLESIRKQPLLLQAFLQAMPKGGDLHNHLSGAVYAETYIKWALEEANRDLKEAMCIDKDTLKLSLPKSSETPCEGKIQLTEDTAPELYGRMIDTWSMRNHTFSGKNGHEHFFDSFKKFDEMKEKWMGHMLADVKSRAAAQNVSYLELMLTPISLSNILSDLAKKLKWNNNFDEMYSELQHFHNEADIVKKGWDDLEKIENTSRAELTCDPPAQPQPGCNVEVRYIFQVRRSLPKAEVFARMVAAFWMVSHDKHKRMVGLNLVEPEDGMVSMRDFSDHMRMLDFLHKKYPTVNVTLHAGELAPERVPFEKLGVHIRQAVELGHAKRIGHGVDIMYADKPFELLAQMKDKRVMVEICLSSNALILGIRGRQHPLSIYIKHGVPVALGTDDEGVARSNITQEYLKAVQEHELGYVQLKKMVRTSLEHAFITGGSLWEDDEKFQPVTVCSGEKLGSGFPSSNCQKFLTENKKAELQWKLEESFINFEINSNKFIID